MNILVIGKEGRLALLSRDGRLEKHNITYVEMSASDEEMLAKGKNADCVLIDAMGTIHGDVIRSMPNLKMIHSEGVGFQGVDLAAASEQGVYVCNCRGTNATAVAEHAVMLMIGCLRNMIQGNQDVLEGRQIQTKEAYMKSGSLRELSECTIGLVGFGAIGREIARLTSVFGAKCIYYNRSKAPAELEYGAERKELDEVLAEADIVSMNLPVTDLTRNIADEAFFSKVKPGAIFINTARGELVDSAALINAVKQGQISMAGLDCVAGEPVTSDNPMINAEPSVLKRIIFTPHIAGITGSTFKRNYELFWSNVDRIDSGERPVNIVNGL